MSNYIIRVFSFIENLFLDKFCYTFNIEIMCQIMNCSNFLYNKLRQFLNQGVSPVYRESVWDPGLSTQISPLIIGWDRFIFTNFRFSSLFISDLLVFKKFLMCSCKNWWVLELKS